MIATAYIKITTDFIGFHYWKNAPLEFQYLRQPHRHKFIVTACKEVQHDDRDIEFIYFKKQVDEFISETWANSSIMSDYIFEDSCEMIARKILEKFGCSYVEVSEDGENGAFVIPQQTENKMKTITVSGGMIRQIIDDAQQAMEEKEKEKKELFRFNPFYGIEAEGPRRYSRTVFIPFHATLGTNDQKIKKLMTGLRSSFEQMHVESVYIGAGNQPIEFHGRMPGYFVDFLNELSVTMVNYGFDLERRMYLTLEASDFAFLWREIPSHPNLKFFRKMLVGDNPNVSVILLTHNANDQPVLSMQYPFYCKRFTPDSVIWTSEKHDLATKLDDPLYAADTLLFPDDVPFFEKPYIS